jgi:CRP/FNR family transcriptional regulator, cyclic AMP receptor protein
MNGCAVIDDAPGEEQQQLLAKMYILKELPEREVDHLATRSQLVRLGEKESLTLGEDLRGILFLVSGRVRVHAPNFGGQDLTFSVVEGGALVGQSGSTPRTSRALLVEALEASVLRVVEWEDFERLVLRNPKVGVNTIRLFGERLEKYEDRLSNLIRKEVPARLAGLLLRLSERQDAMANDGERRIPDRYTHRLLASMVGSNREAVTRAFGVLRKAGAVETRDRQIYVTDADALEGLAEAER